MPGGHQLAVAVGFEPTVGLTPHNISSVAPSAARTRHRAEGYRRRPAGRNPAAPSPALPGRAHRPGIVRTDGYRDELWIVSPVSVPGRSGTDGSRCGTSKDWIAIRSRWPFASLAAVGKTSTSTGAT